MDWTKWTIKRNEAMDQALLSYASDDEKNAFRAGYGDGYNQARADMLDQLKATNAEGDQLRAEIERLQARDFDSNFIFVENIELRTEIAQLKKKLGLE